MPRMTASKRSLSAVANFLNGFNRQRRIQLVQAASAPAAGPVLLC